MQEVDKLRKLLTAVKNYVDNNIPIRISDYDRFHINKYRPTHE